MHTAEDLLIRARTAEARIAAAKTLADDWLAESRGERMVPVSALRAVRDALDPVLRGASPVL